jgi:hypothetical protein
MSSCTHFDLLACTILAWVPDACFYRDKLKWHEAYTHTKPQLWVPCVVFSSFSNSTCTKLSRKLIEKERRALTLLDIRVLTIWLATASLSQRSMHCFLFLCDLQQMRQQRSLMIFKSSSTSSQKDGYMEEVKFQLHMAKPVAFSVVDWSRAIRGDRIDSVWSGLIGFVRMTPYKQTFPNDVQNLIKLAISLS